MTWRLRPGRGIVRRAALAAVLTLGMGCTALRAQGIERSSMAAGSETPPSSIDNQPYNLKLGDVNLRMDASVTTSFNDNINIAKNGREADIYITPMLGLHLLWQPTVANTLNLDVNIGYQTYIYHSGYSNLVVSPTSASQLQYNIFVGDFKINVHDIFSYQQDPLSVGQLSNTAQFARFTNTAGVRADWDLNSMVVSLGYDHQNFWVFEPEYQYLDYQSDTISPQVSFTLSPTITAGVNSSFTDMRYHETVQPNNTTVSFGPFVTAQLTPDLSVNGSAGASLANYDGGAGNGDATTENYTYYVSGGLSHRISDSMTETLTAGRESIPGISSDYTERIYANYGNSWQVTPTFTLGASLWWENLQDSGGYFTQTANRYGVTLSGGHPITNNLSCNMSYQYVLKVANPTSLGYYQNLVTIGLDYQF